ncbi:MULTISPECIES: CobW family GTP-binding protein [Leptolyngbya]|uniref:CobW family GTP-binding protein n=1 Tax=Leptolyngbya TaxID=47251 RepID=UPI0016836FD8|nr:GTP-binding protein [Leptolyngbya sp. FACHB-1624]MBD1855562.1 GTP-binding protein [Leptolyngbya sp. FACHB-1624]
MPEELSIPETRLPVTIITGFLGSGKTTLLNQILKNYHDVKVAVLVNEFGSINIDSQLLISIDEDMIELSNGCICCTINDNLVNAVYSILERRDRIDYLIVETTGLADPLPIALTFLSTELRDFTRLDSILTLVDAATFTSEHYGSEISLQQIIYGDIIILNKIDLVSEAQVDEIEDFIRDIKDKARVLRTQQGYLPLSLILGVHLLQESAYSSIQADPAILSQSESPRSIEGFTSVTFESDRPFSLKKFQEFLDYQLPDNVFRAKGILWFSESPARHIFQLSGKRFHLEDSDWNGNPKNEIVLIGRKLDALFLTQTLNNCLTR